MTEKTIQFALLRNFASHSFKFTNAYYFNNESDFLSFLPSGFCYEIEIKISRSDFKADFKKEKHTVHGANEKKGKTFLRKVKDNIAYNVSWEICKYFPELIKSEERFRTKRHYRPNFEETAEDICEITFTAHVSSEIEFVETKNKMLPNKFFYAVPNGLIKKDEVPEYAGLLYINDDGSIDKIKDGKFLHKDHLDVVRLFKKTYYSYERELWQKLKTDVQR